MAGAVKALLVVSLLVASYCAGVWVAETTAYVRDVSERLEELTRHLMGREEA